MSEDQDRNKPVKRSGQARAWRERLLTPLLRSERSMMWAVLGALVVVTVVLVLVSREGAGNEPVEDTSSSSSSEAFDGDKGGALIDTYSDAPACDHLSQAQHAELDAQQADLNQPSHGPGFEQRKCVWSLPDRGLTVELTTKRFAASGQQFGSAAAQAEFNAGGGNPVGSPKIGDGLLDRGCADAGCQLVARHANLLIYVVIASDGQHGAQGVRELAYGLITDYADSNLGN